MALKMLRIGNSTLPGFELRRAQFYMQFQPYFNILGQRVRDRILSLTCPAGDSKLFLFSSNLLFPGTDSGDLAHSAAL